MRRVFLQALAAHGLALSKLGQYARAIPLLRTVVNRGVTAHGIDTDVTVQAAVMLAASYVHAGEMNA